MGGNIADTVWDFVLRCRKEDGGYAPSPDPDYLGNSDTRASDLAAPTYAAVLARSLNRELPDAARTAEFLQRHQQSDGSFANQGGDFDPVSDLALLYNTTQATVGLRALGGEPRVRPIQVMDRFFEEERFKALPWYTTSFFPLFYAALGEPFPQPYNKALQEHMIANQAEDGYLGDHVAATFHMAHFFRLAGEPTPRAAEMVERTLRDQQPDGGWHLRPPDWDVHSCFDAVFILRQLGGGSERCQDAIGKAAEWVLKCRNADGGFGHYSGWPSDMDAVYFQLGTLLQAERIPGAASDLPDVHTLGWGHAMQPGRSY